MCRSVSVSTFAVASSMHKIYDSKKILSKLTAWSTVLLENLIIMTPEGSLSCMMM
jgi:hypothetical protein